MSALANANASADADADAKAGGTLLLIDIGNTRLKWAWCGAHSPGAAPSGALPVPWRAAGACGHEALPTLAADWRALADAEGAPRGVWISNVAGPVIAAEVDALLADAFGAPPAVHWARATASHGTLDNGYREPTQLGVDRWVGAIGARRHLPEGHLLIVTAGTATTIDVVLAPGSAGAGTPARSRFAGGMILPGLALMMGSLARNTAQLPAVEIAEAQAMAAWADNTRDAIAAGCLAAQAGAIERAWSALTRRGPARCLLSGGAREALAGALTLPFERHENLVLLGLSVMAAQQRAS
ncbi:type III pantothenate kinase [Cupriavidus gilardii]|uniref:Type III pantothenate kinase n=1 Tax=Cupriavidus gilardii TaxID=82541 RepID=A0ABY4VSR3_9BURK|nr:type III pantothenate kinase [Cupriavidus gilardii]USE80030.1 type III pantothenate kinase [Cupriavidus gilardii]